MKKFKWDGDRTVPRRGPTLLKGLEYDASLFSPGAVETWISQGLAKPVEKKSKTKNGGNDK